MSCGELLVRMLENYGITYVFGVPGTHTIEQYRGLSTSSIRHVSPRHEQGAGFMADGSARVTGRPAACFTVSGPGALNITAAMGQALQDSVPMLVISSDNSRSLHGFGGGRLHETAGIGAAIAQCSPWQHTIMAPSELPQVLARAFAIFESQRPGPVHITILIDVITAPADGVDASRWPMPSRPAPDPAALMAAASRINAAERPVIALGGDLIRIDIDLAQLTRKARPAVAICADARLAIDAL